LNHLWSIPTSFLLAELCFLGCLFALWIAAEFTARYGKKNPPPQSQNEKRMTKPAVFIALLLCLLLPSFALAEVQIPLACRVANLPPGRCGWCALETLARHHSIKALYGVVAKNATNSRPKDLEGAVIENGVKYRSQRRGCLSTEILEDAIRENLGAVVGFRPLSAGGRGHIVTLVDFGDAEVRIIDPNDTDRRVRSMDREMFLERWDGFALVLERP
jgi:hypothetical protein